MVATAAIVPEATTEHPPLGHTGGFGEETCAVCHIGTEVNSSFGFAGIRDIPGTFVPGETYELLVVLDADDTQVSGFQLSARHDPSGQNAGRFEAVDDRVAVRDSAGVYYAHQTLEGTRYHSTNAVFWRVNWIAPLVGYPRVTFNVAANSGNGDNSPLGDLVFTYEASILQTMHGPTVVRARRAAGIGVEPPLPRVDSVRLLRDLSVLSADSMEGRLPGTPGSLRARRYLTEELGASGAEPLGDGYAHPFEFRGRTGENLIAVVPGTGSEKTIVLTAHYDHVGVRNGEIYNGADDNASGTAAALEVARQLSQAPLRNTVVIALVDAEETGLAGANAFVADPPIEPDSIYLNVNLDMVSRTGGTLWAAGAYHYPELRPALERAAAEAPLRLRLGHDRPGVPGEDDWTNLSDHAPFHAAGIPFVYLGVEDHPDYHQPTDDFERVDPGEFVAAVRTIFIALRYLDAHLTP